MASLKAALLALVAEHPEWTNAQIIAAAPHWTKLTIKPMDLNGRSKSAVIRELLVEHPEWNPGRIAQEVGCSMMLVKSIYYAWKSDPEATAAYKARWQREHTTEVNARNRAWKRNNPEAVEEQKTRRRGLIAGHEIPAERIIKRKVYERDGWICGICTEPIDPALAYPDSRSVSLDHVIPITRGGAHTYVNVQAAHFGCNSRKGATTTEGSTT